VNFSFFCWRWGGTLNGVFSGRGTGSETGVGAERMVEWVTTMPYQKTFWWEKFRWIALLYIVVLWCFI